MCNGQVVATTPAVPSAATTSVTASAPAPTTEQLLETEAEFTPGKPVKTPSLGHVPQTDDDSDSDGDYMPDDGGEGDEQVA